MSRPGRVLPLKTIKLKEDGKMARLTHMKLRKSDGTTEIKIPPVRKILADDPQYQISFEGAFPCHVDLLMKSKEKHAADQTSRMIKRGTTLCSDTNLTDADISLAASVDPNFCRVTTANPIYGYDTLIEGSPNVTYSTDVCEIRQFVVDIDELIGLCTLENRLKTVGDRIYDATAIVAKANAVDPETGKKCYDPKGEPTKWHLFIQIPTIKVVGTDSSMFRYLRHIVETVLDPSNAAVSTIFASAAGLYNQMMMPLVGCSDEPLSEMKLRRGKLLPMINQVYLATFNAILNIITDLDTVPDEHKELVKKVLIVCKALRYNLTKYQVDDASNTIMEYCTHVQRMLNISLGGDTNCGGINHPINTHSYDYVGVQEFVDGDNNYICIKPATKTVTLKEIMADIIFINPSQGADDRTSKNSRFTRKWLTDMVRSHMLTNRVDSGYVMDRGELRRQISQRFYVFPAEVMALYTGGRLGYSAHAVRKSVECRYRVCAAQRNMFYALMNKITEELDAVLIADIENSTEETRARIEELRADYATVNMSCLRTEQYLDHIRTTVQEHIAADKNMNQRMFTRRTADDLSCIEAKQLWGKYLPDVDTEELTTEVRRAYQGDGSEFIRIARPKWTKGNRHNMTFTLSHQMYSARVPLMGAQNIITKITLLMGDEEATDRLDTVERVYKWRAEHGQNASSKEMAYQAFRKNMKACINPETRKFTAFGISSTEEEELMKLIAPISALPFQTKLTPEEVARTMPNLGKRSTVYTKDLRASMVDHTILEAAQKHLLITRPEFDTEADPADIKEFMDRINILSRYIVSEQQAEARYYSPHCRVSEGLKNAWRFYLLRGFGTNKNNMGRLEKLEQEGLITREHVIRRGAYNNIPNKECRVHITPAGELALKENTRRMYIGENSYVEILLAKGYLPTNALTIINDAHQIARDYANNIQPARYMDHRLDTDVFSFIPDECRLSTLPNGNHYARGMAQQALRMKNRPKQTHYRTSLLRPETPQPVVKQASSEDSSSEEHPPFGSTDEKFAHDLISCMDRIIWKTHKYLHNIPSQFGLFAAFTIIRETMVRTTGVFPIHKDQLLWGVTREELQNRHNENLEELYTTHGWNKFNLSARKTNQMVAMQEVYMRGFVTMRTNKAHRCLEHHRNENERARELLYTMDHRQAALNVITDLDTQYAQNMLPKMLDALKAVAESTSVSHLEKNVHNLCAQINTVISSRVYRHHIHHMTTNELSETHQNELEQTYKFFNIIQYKMRRIEELAAFYSRHALMEKCIGLYQHAITIYTKAVLLRKHTEQAGFSAA